MKWVYDSIDFGFSFFNSFLEFDENLFFFLIKTEIDVDKFIFFDEFFSCLDVFFFHLWDIDFGILEKEILEDEFLLFLLFLFALKFWDGLIGIHDDEFKFLDSVFEDMDLFFDGGVFTGKLTIFRVNEFQLLMKILKLFL